MILHKDIRSRLVRTTAELAEATHAWRYDVPVVADVETFGTDPRDGKLLGIALCSVERPTEPVYVVLQWYDFRSSTWNTNREAYCPLLDYLKVYLSEVQLVGHNYAYDKGWIDFTLGINTKWKACTRLMWHMASAPSGPRPYGLKDAQVEVLGWEKRGDLDLVAQVEARGGKIKEGGHYLADVEVLGHYACLDGASTALLFSELSKFFDQHDYWWMLEKMVRYSWLLQECTNAGIAVDVPALEHQVQVLSDTREAYASRFIELVGPALQRLEACWREDRAARYQLDSARSRFLGSWDLQKKFKLSSDKDKRELFYDVMGLPVVMETDGGKPSTAVDAIKLAVRESRREDLGELLEALEEYEKAETLLNSFVKPWLGVVRNGRLHPRFNPCGTVSYRLSGFKPYLLNAPFDETEIMSCLRCDEGWIGVHADFTSIEPCVTAHYSQDPHLLKVFRDGLGDVYLDLALTLFPRFQRPHEAEGKTALELWEAVERLHKEYDPQVPIRDDIKKLHKLLRLIAKIIQLAVQYTGTKYTVSKNLSYAGFPTTLERGDQLVQAYWLHFRKVAVMNEALFRRFAKQRHLRNVVGRVIRVPTHVDVRRRDGTIWQKPLERFKDLPNRFVQSSAHDLLSFWVLRIAELVKERKLRAKPVILDCHDSTSWQAPKEEVEALEQVFRDALAWLNETVRMTVPVKVEMKRFQTLAGLKGEE